jgi:hypothetical protein
MTRSPATDQPCRCSACLALGNAIEREAAALHLVEQTRAQVEAAGRQVDRHHHLASTYGDWSPGLPSTARQPK